MIKMHFQSPVKQINSIISSYDDKTFWRVKDVDKISYIRSLIQSQKLQMWRFQPIVKRQM